MNDKRPRLTKCFTAVFPDLPASLIPAATPASVPGWDSLASLTLLAVIEEEFGMPIDPGELDQLQSYEDVRVYLDRHLGPE